MRRALVVAIVVGLLLVSVSSGFAATADFAGRTVTYCFWGDLGVDFAEAGRAPGRHEEAEELFNVKIEFLSIPFGEYIEALMTRLLAGDSENDIWMVQNRQFWHLISQNAFYPLSTIMPQSYYEGVPALPRAIGQSLSYQGVVYPFGVDFGSLNPLSVMVWNRDLFEREGLPDPHDLYDAGEWTWDVVTELAKQATRDTTGDGELDQWGLSSSSGINGMANKYIHANDGSITIEEDGRILFAMDREPALAALNQVYQWRMIDRVYGGGWQSFVDGKVAMMDIGIYLIRNTVNPNMEESFGVISFPKGPHAADYRYPGEAIRTFVLPANVTHPEALVELTHFLWPEDEYDDAVELFIYETVRDRRSAEFIQMAHDNFSGEVFQLENVFGPLWGNTPLTQALQAMLSGEKSINAAIGEIRPTLQAVLDDMFDQ